MQIAFAIQQEKSGRWYFDKSIYPTMGTARSQLTARQNKNPNANYRIVRITNIKVVNWSMFFGRLTTNNNQSSTPNRL